MGAARAGFEVLGAVDSDPQVLGVHAKNFPGASHSNADVSELTGGSLGRLFELPNKGITGIVGGPPCQGFSNMGRRDLSDRRNQLFAQFFRVVNEAQPTFFLAENVLGILHKQYAEMREFALAQVSRDYVILDPIKICAADYGAPTSRTRVFFVGYLPDRMEKLSSGSFDPPGELEPVLVRDALEGLPVHVDPKWQKEEDGWRRSESHGSGYFSIRLQKCVPSGVGDAVALRRLATEGLSSGTLGTCHSKEVASVMRPSNRVSAIRYQKLNVWTRRAFVRPCGRALALIEAAIKPSGHPPLCTSSYHSQGGCSPSGIPGLVHLFTFQMAQLSSDRKQRQSNRRGTRVAGHQGFSGLNIVGA